MLAIRELGRGGINIWFGKKELATRVMAEWKEHFANCHGQAGSIISGLQHSILQLSLGSQPAVCHLGMSSCVCQREPSESERIWGVSVCLLCRRKGLRKQGKFYTRRNKNGPCDILRNVLLKICSDFLIMNKVMDKLNRRTN